MRTMLAEYNGHTNWPTWNAVMHFDSDEGLYSEMRRYGRLGSGLSSGRKLEEFTAWVAEVIASTVGVDGAVGKDMQGFAREQGKAIGWAIGAIDMDRMVKSAWDAAGYVPCREVTAADVEGSNHEGLCRECYEPVGAPHEDWCDIIAEEDTDDAPGTPDEKPRGWRPLGARPQFNDDDEEPEDDADALEALYPQAFTVAP